MKCTFRKIFGLPCPGCGMTRAWKSVLRGNVKQGFDYHPLWWTTPFIFTPLLFQNFHPFFRKLVNSKAFGATIIGLFLVCYVIRFKKLNSPEFNRQV
jgi:hypothetical protein